MSRLEALGVTKRFRLREVVKDLSLSIESGQVVGLLGPNGAGKTTAFYMIVGLIRCDRGSIRLNGRDITRLPVHRRARLGVGYLPQEASVFRKLSVADNIRAILETRRDLDRVARQTKLEELMEELHIGHVRDSLGVSLSGGERRRVEIARALAAEPKFVLLDEPFAGVDPINVQEIQGLVRQMRERNIGILITDHNVRETLKSTDRAYIIHEGRILREGTAEELIHDERVKEVYLGHSFDTPVTAVSAAEEREFFDDDEAESEPRRENEVSDEESSDETDEDDGELREERA
jgi:lipopolysaccharide export system ATP-binding protein